MRKILDGYNIPAATGQEFGQPPDLSDRCNQEAIRNSVLGQLTRTGPATNE